MATSTSYPPYQQLLLDRSGHISKPWQLFFLSLAGGPGTGTGTGAPVDATYLTAAAEADLTHERVIVPSATIAWNLTTPGQVSADLLPHHATHEPGGSDALVNAAWTDVANTFTASPQTVEGAIHAESITVEDPAVATGQVVLSETAFGGEVKVVGTALAGRSGSVNLADATADLGYVFCDGQRLILNDVTTGASVGLGGTTSPGAIWLLPSSPGQVEVYGGLQVKREGDDALALGVDKTTGIVTMPFTTTPAHALTHKSGGSDAIKLDELAAPTDSATLNATTSAHGLLPKLTGVASDFLRADGTFATPVPSSAGVETTWTPILGGLGGTSGQTYVQQSGQALKIGHWVFAAFYIALSNKGTITGNCMIGNLPYPPIGYLSEGAFTNYCLFDSLVTNWITIHCYPAPGATYAPLRGLKAAGTSNNAGGGAGALVAADISNSTFLASVLIYMA